MKDSICTILQLSFLLAMILGWMFIHFTGSDLIIMVICFTGFGMIELIRKI